MGIHESYYEVLYAREVVRLSGYAARHRLPGTLYAYLAYGGATLSAKDALAQGMLAIAQEKGFLKPGQPVVECSSGTFAVELAIACSHSGHPLVLCVPGSIGPARQKLLTELGAKLAFTTGGRTGAAARAQAVAMRTGGYFLNYFDNDINAEFHRRVTGPAIVKATGGELDAIVVGVGSGGTITGVGEYVKAWYPDVRIIAVEPAESQALAGGVVGRHSIPGIGAGFVPENYNAYIVDGVVAVPSARAGVLAQEVLRTDAVPAAPSAGAVLCAMHSLVQKEPSIRRVLGVFSGAQAVE